MDKIPNNNEKLNRSFDNRNFIEDKEGNKYVIENLSKTLVKYKGQKLQWKAEVISNCGIPYVGKPEIRTLTLKNDKILVVFGKHSFAEVAIKDGEVTCLGAD